MKKERDIVMVASESGVIMSEVGPYDTDMVLIAELPEHLRTSDRPHNHLYILSDEEIKEGDWYYNELDKAVRKNNAINHPYHRKIIATTDAELTGKCDGCKRAKGTDTIYTCNCNVNKIHQIPQHIIKAYVEKPFDKVMVECEYLGDKGLLIADFSKEPPETIHRTEPKPLYGAPKLNQDGTLAVSLVSSHEYFQLISENLVECKKCGIRLETGVFNLGQHMADCPKGGNRHTVSLVEEKSELDKCKESIWYFMTNYATIDGKPFQTLMNEEEFNKWIKENL